MCAIIYYLKERSLECSLIKSLGGSTPILFYKSPIFETDLV